MTSPNQIETTTETSSEVSFMIDDFMRAFDAYKETNDEKLRQLERRSAADVVTTEKLARLDRVVDELAHKQTRPGLPGEGTRSPASLQMKAAFEGYMRRGDTSLLGRSGAGADASRLVGLEGKALAAGTGADGGYLVPPETEATVNRALKAISPIRALATVRQVSGTIYRKPFAVTGVDTGWTGETAARPQTSPPTLAALDFPTMELYAMPAASQTLLDDAIVNIDQWIAEEVRLAFAQQEGQAFITGDGVNKPKGFLAYDTVANSAWVFGKLGYLATGVAGAFPATSPSDKLIDLIYSVKAGYRANGTFVMNRATQSVVRKMKDGEGRYLWEPSKLPGQPATLMGFPVAESEDMPDIGAGSLAIAFGDFQRGYLVVDRVGISVLRDPFSAKPYVLFYTTKRVGGGVQDFEAIKLLKFSA